MKTKIETFDYVAIAAVIVCIILSIHYVSCGIFTHEVIMKMIIIAFVCFISAGRVIKFIRHFQNV